MGRHHRHDSLRRTKVDEEFPSIYYDPHLNFASIKLAPGIESRSYEKGGYIFCEDKRGAIIEIQILNPKRTAKAKSKGRRR